MRKMHWVVLAGLLAGLPTASARAGVGVSVGIGVPGPYCYRPYRYWYGGCYRPWYPGIGVGVVVPIGTPAVVVPPPVIVQPAPTVIQAAPAVVQPAYPTPVPAPAPVPAPVTVRAAGTAAGSRQGGLRTGGPLHPAPRQSRRQGPHGSGAATRSVARPEALEPLSQMLSGDRSPQAREAAARALGLIGSPASLPALQQAAQADDDREVRNSARFAVDVIRSRNP